MATVTWTHTKWNEVYKETLASLYWKALRIRILRRFTLDRSGSVCLDVINQTWSPMFDMINIFEVFLPQLLRYPNPTDPLNGEAAALLIREPKSYDAKVKGALEEQEV